LCEHDIRPFAIWESGRPACRCYFRSQRGREDVESAITGAKDCHQPIGTPVFYAVDFNADLNDATGPVRTYAVRFKAAIGPYKPAAYGNGLVLRYLLDEGLICRVTCPARPGGTSMTSS
jgi:hypothetical protein